ncbi:MAG: histidine kinase dimerization/phosphoacceptor domain -containing protein [Candidatus Aminicenantales bacterium]
MISESGRYARVKVENEQSLVLVPISNEKPEISEKIQKKWQKIVDLIAQLMHVPSGLITRLTEDNLEIFIASHTEKNPYKKNDKDRLGIGMFCETVAGRRNELVVANTQDSDYWRNNPHAGLGMKSYLGVPIQWNDGELFGTFCMLDDKINQYSQSFQDLMLQFKEIIETDLDHVEVYEQLKKKISAKEIQIREVHHRIKNHFNLLISMIRLQSRDVNNEQDMQNLLLELQSRIRTISLIHDRLYKSVDESAIALDTYIKQLCHYIIIDFAKQKTDVRYFIDPVFISQETSLPCGLIISELLTNSIKHAFKGIEKPEIEIHAHLKEGKTLSLTYLDNGIGFPHGFSLNQVDSLGMNIIKLLVQQMDGELNISPGKGARFDMILRLG